MIPVIQTDDAGVTDLAKSNQASFITWLVLSSTNETRSRQELALQMLKTAHQEYQNLEFMADCTWFNKKPQISSNFNCYA